MMLGYAVKLPRVTYQNLFMICVLLGCSHNSNDGNGQNAEAGVIYPDADIVDGTIVTGDGMTPDPPIHCGAGQIECEGRCVDPDLDRESCGGCANSGGAGMACADGEVCSGGGCSRSCGGETPTICGDACVDTLSDRVNCGGCAGEGGVSCAAGELCSDGVCALSCGGRTPLLCGERCVDTQTSRVHCGGCAGEGGATCPAGRRCVGGACELTCGGATPLMCGSRCVDPLTNRDHCGACAAVGGRVCDAGEVCSGGVCTLTCGGTTPVECGGGCYDTTSDRRHCGGCSGSGGERCGTDEVCEDGSCKLRCPGSERACGTTCTNLDNDPNNCGDCGNVCTGAPGALAVCSSGECFRVCNSRRGDCNGDLREDVTNGCETDLLDNPAHCGGCGRSCAAPSSAGAMCVGPECTITCSVGFGDCNEDRYSPSGDGCETRTYYDPDHCGGCGMPCPGLPQSASSCEEGRCDYTCEVGHGDCNADLGAAGSDGCESDFATDRANCGACGAACAPGEACTRGRCRGPSRLVFLSSRLYTGNFGAGRSDGLTGLLAADAECTELARAAGITESTFYAWLSGKDALFAWATPVTRFFPAMGNYVLVDGTVVASSWGDFIGGSLLHPIDQTETGGAPTDPGAGFPDSCRGGGQPFWSNTTAAGAVASVSGDCDGTAGSAGGAGVRVDTMGGSVWGTSARTDVNWPNACGVTTASGSCGWQASLLCVEQ